MSEQIQDILSMAMSIPVIGFSGWIIWKQLGGWVGVKSKYFLGPLVVAFLGLAIMATGTLGLGMTLSTLGLMAAPVLPTMRFTHLTRIMRRLDDYVEGAVPLPFPDDDDVARRDLTKAHHYFADPVLSRRFDPVVVARVAALHDGRPLPAAVPARD
jgi:hypothetical protein